MGFVNSAKNFLSNTGLIGNNYGSNFGYATPAGGDTIPTATLTKAQKTFSSSAENPNLPKPKSLYFVYFSLNKDLASKIEDKQKFIKEISGREIDGTDLNNALNNESSSSVFDSVIGEGNAFTKLFKSKKEIDNSEGRSNQSRPTSVFHEETLADFIPNIDVFKKLSYEISKLVKSHDKPNINFTVTELNEYNRKRLIYDKITYKDITISFFDVKDNPVQQFFNAYLKFINGDNLCKDYYMWEKPIDNRHFLNQMDSVPNTSYSYTTVDGDNIQPTTYGNLNSFGLNINSHFRLIDKICFCEYYMDRMMVYTIENPIITDINWGSNVAGDFNSNEIKVTFKYEGVTNDLLDIEPYNVEDWYTSGSGKQKSYLRYMVNKEIKKDVAKFLQTKYNTLSNNIVSDITSILKGYMNGDVKFSWKTLYHQGLDTARKYGYAAEANTVSQIEHTIDNYNESSNKSKYLVNIATDPTSLIGKVSSATSSSRGSNIIL